MMMMGTSSSSSSSNQSGNVFTAAQWEELEQQALIYKYMVSGVPVPSQLILSLRRSLLYNTSSSSSSSSNQTTLGGGVWEGGSSCYPYNNQFLYQIGGGGRKIDLEPGRCRRTDGKKWRCSKEAYPDSKYCERHMHRGRNRSRKPVEFSSSSSSSLSSSSSSSATTPVNVSSSPSAAAPISLHTTNNAYPPFSSTFMDNSSNYSHHSLKHYRQLEGMKDLGGDQDDRSAAYFQLNDPYTTTTQKMSSDHHHHHHHHNYSHFNFQNLKDDQKKQEKQHCFVMGTDFIKPSEETTKSNNTKPDETTTKQQQQQQPFHHFFSPPKSTLLNPNHEPNWAGQVDHNPKATLSTQDLFQSKPRPYW